MAFTKNNLAPIGNDSFGASGIGAGTGKLKGAPRSWSYITEDSQNDINTAGYFDEVSGLLQIGDEIRAVIVATNNGGGISAVVRFTVLSNANGTVDVSNGVTESISDTD